jgi:hypothetical protein
MITYFKAKEQRNEYEHETKLAASKRNKLNKENDCQ